MLKRWRVAEPSSYQRDIAQQRYEGVGDWLSRSDDPLLAEIAIRLQGSVAIGTTVKPIGIAEYDVDLVAHVPEIEIAISPPMLKRHIGDRLRANGHYAPCWRKCPTAGGSTMPTNSTDITPSISNPGCPHGGELVPDRALKSWKASNPMGYRAKFERRAELRARIRSAFGRMVDSTIAKDSVESYPEEMKLKGLLRRTVQIAKRHRDLELPIRNGLELAPSRNQFAGTSKR